MKSALNPNACEAALPSAGEEASHTASADEVPQAALRGQAPGGAAPFVAHVVPADRDLLYDRVSGELLLPVEVVLRDGSTEPSVLRVGPGRVELLSIQLEQAIDQRQAALNNRSAA
ncbi:hypothetical protein [Streptomyces sp. NPDC001502]|uniref:hypothetical protein n=1 Tax=Streptomyces sp. NPDC001502 TaxID=3364578 RepID=UPI0036C816DB